MVQEFVFNNPHVAVVIFSLILIFIINLIYKFTINQDEAKQNKGRQKELKEEMKRYRKEGNLDKANELMGEMMKLSSKQMRMTMRPMMVSMIIFIILLPIVGSLYDYASSFEDNKAAITIMGNEYEVTKINGTLMQITGAAEFECDGLCRQSLQGADWNIRYEEGSFFSGEEKVIFARILAILPFSLPLIGDDLGWLGVYIILAIILGIPIRRAMKIHI